MLLAQGCRPATPVCVLPRRPYCSPMLSVSRLPPSTLGDASSRSVDRISWPSQADKMMMVIGCHGNACYAFIAALPRYATSFVSIRSSLVACLSLLSFRPLPVSIHPSSFDSPLLNLPPLIPCLQLSISICILRCLPHFWPITQASHAKELS